MNEEDGNGLGAVPQEAAFDPDPDGNPGPVEGTGLAPYDQDEGSAEPRGGLWDWLDFL